MSWSFLLLISFVPYVCCISLTSSPDEVKPPGETVKLSCQISGYALTDYGTAWIRQPPGKSMEWIGIIWGGGGINNGASFKTRFSISRDTSSNVLYLDISSLKPEDTAVYYCAKTATAIQLSGRGVQKPRKSKNFNTKCNDDQTDKFLWTVFDLVCFCGEETRRVGHSVLYCLWILACSWLHWIRQKPGQGLEWIGGIDGGTGTIFAQSLQGQFSINKDTNKNLLYLEMNSMRTEDTAVYYCARHTQ
ncbi:uncharacterized protein ighd [Tachysurus ichikawai]